VIIDFMREERARGMDGSRSVGFRGCIYIVLGFTAHIYEVGKSGGTFGDPKR
jgi:hypothetical protein